MSQRLEAPHEPVGLQVAKRSTNRGATPSEALSGSAFVEPDHVATPTGQAVEVLHEELAVFLWSAASAKSAFTGDGSTWGAWLAGEVAPDDGAVGGAGAGATVMRGAVIVGAAVVVDVVVSTVASAVCTLSVRAGAPPPDASAAPAAAASATTSAWPAVAMRDGYASGSSLLFGGVVLGT